MNSPATRRWPGGLAALLVLTGWAAAQAALDPRMLWSVPAHPERIAALAVSPNGLLVASASWDKTVKVYDGGQGRALHTLAGHTDRVFGVAFSPDGGLIAAASQDQSVKFWTANTGMLVGSIAGTARLSGDGNPVAFSPDGTYLAATLSGTNGVGLWRVSDRTRIADFRCQTPGTEWIAFSPDGKLLVAGGGYRGLDTTIKVWRVEDRTLIKTIPTSNQYGVRQLAFSPDGSLLASGAEAGSSSGQVEVWWVSDWNRVGVIPIQARRLAFSPDGVLLATARGNSVGRTVALDLWRAPGWTPGYSLNSPTPPGDMGAIAFAPDGSRLFVSSGVSSNSVDGTVYLGYLSAIQLPATILTVSVDAGQMTLRVGGGSGRYQLQRTAELKGAWVNVGEPTTARQFTVPQSGPTEFFRLVESAQAE